MKRNCHLLAALFICLLPISSVWAADGDTFIRIAAREAPLQDILTTAQGSLLAEVGGYSVIQEDVDFICRCASAMNNPTPKLAQAVDKSAFRRCKGAPESSRPTQVAPVLARLCA